VDAAHPLLQPRRVPGDVVVDHQPAELEVHALARGVGADQVLGSAVGVWRAEQLHLAVALDVVHAAMQPRHLAGEADRLQPVGQVICRVAVLGEHEHLLVAEPRVPHGLQQLLELGLVAAPQDGLSTLHEPVHSVALDDEVRERFGSGGVERRVLGHLVRLAGVGGVLVRRGPLQQVALVRRFPGRRVLRPAEDFGALRLHQLDHGGQALRPALQRGAQGGGRAGQTALEDGHRQARRGAVQARGAVVKGAHVARRALVQLALLGREVEAERVAAADGVERLPVEGDHLLLGAADEVSPPAVRRERTQRLRRGEDV